MAVQFMGRMGPPPFTVRPQLRTEAAVELFRSVQLLQVGRLHITSATQDEWSKAIEVGCGFLR